MCKLILTVSITVLMYSKIIILMASDHHTPRQEVAGSFATCQACSNVLHLECYDRLSIKKCPSCRKPMVTDEQFVVTDTVYVSKRGECAVCIDLYDTGIKPTAPPLDAYAITSGVPAFAGISAAAGSARSSKTHVASAKEFDPEKFHLAQSRLAAMLAATKDPVEAVRLRALLKQKLGEAFRHK